MQAKLFSHEEKWDPTSQEALRDKLITIKERLLVLLGATLMFLLTGFIQPNFMETDSAPLVWIFLMLAPVITGLYLLLSSTWRRLPLIERRNIALGGMVVGLLAFSFLPLWLLQHGDPEATPYIILVTFGGLGLNWAYKKIGRSTEVEFNHGGSDIFP